MEACIRNQPEQQNNFQLLQFKFQNEYDNFKKHSIFEIKKYLNRISTTWKWISFSNNQTSFVFKETDPEAISEFVILKNIQLFNVNIEISISSNNEQNQRRFIHEKKLISLENGIILDYLKTQNVTSIFRIEKRDETGNNVATGSFIIQFGDENIPEFLDIESIQIKTFMLENRPMRCIYCYKLGHTIKKCRILSLRLCKLCHYSYGNNSQTHECNLNCKNCDQLHNSSSKLCPKYIEQQQVIYFKEKYGVSHQEAFNRIKFCKQFENEKINENCHELNTPKVNIELEKSEKSDINTELEIKQNETIKNLQSTIEQLKDDHLKKIKELITKNIKNIQQSNTEKENCSQMMAQVQIRNENLHEQLDFFKHFINSKRTIENEFNKFKRKGSPQ